MIGNIKTKFLPKTGMREKQVLQDPGYVNTVDTCCMLHAMRYGAILIVFTVYVDTVDTNKILFSIHNNIALIFCVNHLNMPFNVHTTDKVTMITMSGFLTI